VVLPLQTLDGRSVEVFIEEKIGDFVLVHDSAVPVTQLYLQGMHLTDGRRKSLEEVARRYGASLDDRGRFQIACRRDVVSDAILRIAQCASLAMYDVIHHLPVFDEEPIQAKVRRTLSSWKQSHFEIAFQVPVKGATSAARHIFDSVAHSREKNFRTVAVKILTFGYGPTVQADRYGFLALDIDRMKPYNDWMRLAVVSKADQWPESALKIVRTLSNRTLEVPTGKDVSVEKSLRVDIEELARTA
jgi:hypothetical protein